MEDQHVIFSEVAAFVDALETLSSFPSQSDYELKVDSEEIVLENDLIKKSETVKEVSKRFRVNSKQQKEVIEDLFEKQKAVVTERSFMNLKGTKRFKSDVWSWFGDIKLLISSSEAKQLKIPFYIRYCGDEQMILSKMFVACFKCTALFIHDSQKSGTSTLRSHMKVCSRPKFNRKRRSPTIIFFPNKSSEDSKEVSSKFEKNYSQNQILNFFLSSQSNFDTVENIEFKKLLQLCVLIGATYGDVNINSMLCPKEKISDYLLNDLYVTGISKFYTELQYTYGASYFLNVWLDENKQSYISLICYYSTLSGELKSVVLHTNEFSYREKLPKDVSDWFVSSLLNQPVVPSKRLIIADPQSNVVAAFMDEHCIKCTTQIFNSILNKLFSGINESEVVKEEYMQLINGCIELITYLEQNSFKLKLPKLWSHLLYCWKDVVNLFKFINHHYETIYSFLSEMNNINLLSFEKCIISEIVNFFHLFEIALQELSMTTEPTMNIYVPWIIKLRKRSMQNDTDSFIVRYFKSKLCVELNEEIMKDLSVYHRIATILDPRFKNMIFLPREDHIKASVKLKALVKECIEATVVEDNIEVNSEFKTEGKERSKFSSLANDLTTEKKSHEEINQYLSEPFQLVHQELDHKQGRFNPLKYWTKKTNTYPHLNKIAFWILSCPASCIKSEESLLDKNWLVNSCRVHLNPEHVNKALFVRSFNKL